ncbi:RAMP superfamily CRISPR-associated protein [Allofournierella massiliensis]|uniref:RAMP superfamily CRISPR-associated protein n=1 Tax=Allofournierella massiliensis TaxID=1650663 RepID=A0ABT7URS0_9FIRM|nr:RAMP superfamily CRISPR-associated protein [Fournierella massiliensis]MDM8201577.1 RAMP superfamily CRISPR-associated protein [Fournierella massiliensis]
MGAKFDYAVRYSVRACCESPLRTGGENNEMEAVLRYPDGRAFVQGASLAGALRSWLEQQNAAMAEQLFGSQKQAGQLVVSDGVFEDSEQQIMRPRLKINGATGTAKDGGKFDVAAIGAGSRFGFELVWMGWQTQADALRWIEQMLAALHQQEIRLGAQKTNGFGAVSLNVKKREFRMNNADDRTAWLENHPAEQEIALPQVQHREFVCFTVKAKADRVLIMAAERELREENQAVTVNLSENGEAIIPASSLKGAIRARAWVIAQYLGCESLVEQMFGTAADGPEKELQAGSIILQDVKLSRAVRQEVKRIRINKFTGGVIQRGLLTQEPISGEIRFDIKIPAEQTEGCGLLLFALRDLGMGLYNIGSGGSIGRGYLNVHAVEAETPEGHTGRMEFSSEGTCKLVDPDKTLEHWIQAVGRKQDEI